MDLMETEWEGVDWMHLASGQGPVAESCENGNESSGSKKGGKFLD
jgi:hypothetical protein